LCMQLGSSEGTPPAMAPSSWPAWRSSCETSSTAWSGQGRQVMSCCSTNWQWCVLGSGRSDRG
jgi:hypothetical protein